MPINETLPLNKSDIMPESLSTIDAATVQEYPTTFLFTPEAARAKINDLSGNNEKFDNEKFDQILKGGPEGSSHQLYALAIIANQDKPRDLNDVYHELYPHEKQAGTSADIEASQLAEAAAASGGWERFV